MTREKIKSIPRVYLNGKSYRLCDVYKYFPVSDTAVRRRYKKRITWFRVNLWEGVYKYDTNL